MTSVFIHAVELLPLNGAVDIRVSGSIDSSHLRVTGLSERASFLPPADGIWTFDLQFEGAHDGPPSEALFPFAVSLPWHPHADWTGVRVIGGQSGESVVRRIRQATSATGSAPTSVNGARVSNGQLVLDIGYSGGRKHAFRNLST